MHHIVILLSLWINFALAYPGKECHFNSDCGLPGLPNPLLECCLDKSSQGFRAICKRAWKLHAPCKMDWDCINKGGEICRRWIDGRK